LGGLFLYLSAYLCLLSTWVSCAKIAELIEMPFGGLTHRSRQLFTIICGRTQKFCRTQVLRFLVRAIHYQFVRNVLRTCSPRWLYFVYRTPTSGAHWTCSL